MKYLRLFVAMIAVGLLASRAEAGKLFPITFTLTATQQSVSGQVTYTTNITATATNIVRISRYTTTNLVINNAKLVKMLANSFNTNLPGTAVIKLDDNGHVVVAVGTNVLLDVNSVLQVSLSGSPSFFAGAVTNTVRTTATGEIDTQRDVYTETTIDSLTYDDSALITADGTTTSFTVTGARTLRKTETFISSGSVGTGTTTFLVTLSGAGLGIISGKDAIVRGAVTGTTTMTGSVF